ncbi:295_t:CDS:2, partial [Racocetra persica]
ALKTKNKTLNDENKNLQNIDEKCKKLVEENEKLSLLNKELTEKNDKLVYEVHGNKNKKLEKENAQILNNSRYEKLLNTNQELQKENEIATYQNERLTNEKEQFVKKICEKRLEYEEKEKKYTILDEKIDIILDNFSFEVVFPLNDTEEKMEKIVELCDKITQIN